MFYRENFYRIIYFKLSEDTKEETIEEVKATKEDAEPARDEAKPAIEDSSEQSIKEEETEPSKNTITEKERYMYNLFKPKHIWS